MRICTWNVNGLRAAIRKGFTKYLHRINPSVLLLQEIRVTPDQLPEESRTPPDWHVYWHPAERKGYSGTAIWSKYPFEKVSVGMNNGDPEGRLVHAKINSCTFINAYLPSGSSGDHRQHQKELWMASFLPWLQEFATSCEPVILGGDLNIAHTEKDIFYAKGNASTSGFLPHERKWFSKLLDSGWHDLVRDHYGDIQGPYSWWSNRGRARELDRGWRIDYLLGNKAAASKFESALILREGGLEVSDHAPVFIDLKPKQ
jgi:exodeoxyribonuclease-3